MKKYIFVIFLFFVNTNLFSSSFSLDKYNIEIKSNFLGEEIVLFGQKFPTHDLIVIMEGEKKNISLIEKVKKNILWTNKYVEYEDIPGFFAIFTLPHKSINELFLIKKLKEKHYLISDSSSKLFKIRKGLEQKSLYFEKSLTEVGSNLFFSKFKIPDNINSGIINIYFYKIINNEIHEVIRKSLIIEKKGFIQKIEYMLYNSQYIYISALLMFAILFSLLSNYLLRKK